jgi:hypothetical protein
MNEWKGEMVTELGQLVEQVEARAKAEARKEVVEKIEKISVDEWWDEIEKFGKSANRNGPQAQAKRDGRDAFKRLILLSLKEPSEEE